jgi:membrane glycosyltransferase
MTISKARKGRFRAEKPARALPEFASSMLLILLIWLLAELVFLPLSTESFTGDMARRVSSLVAALFVIAIGTLLPQAVRNGTQAVELLSKAFVRDRYPKRRQAKMHPFFEGLGRGLLIAVLGIIVSSLLYWIHPVFGGMALLVTIVVVSILLVQAASSWPDER